VVWAVVDAGIVTYGTSASSELPDYPTKKIVFDADAVRERLSKIVDDEDLRR
jgi:ATP-dependent protease HslVU (ClpYQ) ATPase subunit